MADFSRYIMAAIEWGFVPIILGIIFVYGVKLSPSDKSYKSSTRAGKLSGLILFVIFVISQKNRTLTWSFSKPTYGLEILPLVFGVIGGFIFSRAISILLKTRLVGIVSMFLLAGSLITIYTYIFIATYRSTLVFMALGIALGSSLDILFFERDTVPSHTEQDSLEYKNK